MLSGLPALAEAKPSKKQDIAILNYALTLEYLESAFYHEALAKKALAPVTLAAARVIAKHEAAHVKFLKKGLGSHAVKKPKFDFKGTTSNNTKFIQTAITLEARHAGAVRSLGGKTFAPVAFDKPKSMKQVLRAVKKTGFIKG